MAKTARPRKSDPLAESRAGVLRALEACDAKKAADVALLELGQGSGAFTDYFVVCSGTNPRQIQSIADEVEQRLQKAGMRPAHVEGYNQAEWVLLDYVDFVVHVFSENARKFYDLERLWKSAEKIEPAELLRSPRAASKSKTAARTPARAVSRASART